MSEARGCTGWPSSYAAVGCTVVRLMMNNTRKACDLFSKPFSFFCRRRMGGGALVGDFSQQLLGARRAAGSCGASQRPLGGPTRSRVDLIL